MARKRTDHGSDFDTKVEALMRRGGTAESIAAALSAGGVDVSSRTVGRRMRELRGPVAAPRAFAAPQRRAATAARDVVEDVPEEIPETTPLGQIDAWLALVTEAIDKVAPGAIEENLPLFGQLIARAAALSETRRKQTPPTKADPNDHPDMIRLATEATERWREMVALVVGEAAA